MTVTIGRRELLAALGGAAVSWPLAARAQRGRIPRIGLGPPRQQRESRAANSNSSRSELQWLISINSSQRLDDDLDPIADLDAGRSRPDPSAATDTSPGRPGRRSSGRSTSGGRDEEDAVGRRRRAVDVVRAGRAGVMQANSPINSLSPSSRNTIRPPWGGIAMQQIADWLEKLGLSEYTARFAENGIDISVLRYLTDQDLKDIGVLLGHRRKMLAAISELTGA